MAAGRPAVLDKSDVGMHIGTPVKLSNKGRYAVRALFDIAYFNEGQPTQAKDIAERQGIPPRFLEQIFQDLKRAGIVGSKRGPRLAPTSPARFRSWKICSRKRAGMDWRDEMSLICVGRPSL